MIKFPNNFCYAYILLNIPCFFYHTGIALTDTEFLTKALPEKIRDYLFLEERKKIEEYIIFFHKTNEEKHKITKRKKKFLAQSRISLLGKKTKGTKEMLETFTIILECNYYKNSGSHLFIIKMQRWVGILGILIVDLFVCWFIGVYCFFSLLGDWFYSL